MRDTCSEEEDVDEHRDFDAELDESLFGYEAEGSEMESILWAFLREGGLSEFIEKSKRSFLSMFNRKYYSPYI